MIWNPWWKLRLMRERAESAERQVNSLKYLVATLRFDEMLKLRELHFASNALRRKNKYIKNLSRQLVLQNREKKDENSDTETDQEK